MSTLSAIPVTPVIPPLDIIDPARFESPDVLKRLAATQSSVRRSLFAAFSAATL